MAKSIPHRIDGKPRDGQSGRSGPVYDTVFRRGRLRAIGVDEINSMHRSHQVR